MSANCWLVKQEPGDYPFASLVKDGVTAWTGVRNYQARNNLRAMKVGDKALYYHSGDEKQIVGVATVKRSAYADPTAEEGDWVAVDLQALQTLAKPVTLADLKADASLEGLAIRNHTRLSVSPVSAEHFRHILKLSGTKL